MFKLISNQTGKEIKIGDTVADKRGDPFVVLGFTPPHRPGSTGRVIVKRLGEDIRNEFFPTVFDAKIVENKENEENH